MKAGWIKTSLCLLCLGLAAVATAQSKTPSVWDRVQKVDDAELGELIRAAMEDYWEPNKKETLAIIRKVTVSYAQIKLLDQQILQVSQKLKSASGPAEMRYELLLAKTELESKLMSELTNLREMLGVIPKYPFDKQPVDALNTWLRLNPIDDDRVYVLDTEKPMTEYAAMTEFKPLGLMSQSDVLDLIRARLRDPNNLPIRADIFWRDEAAEELRDKVVALIKQLGAEMEADVRLGKNYFIGSGEAPFFLRDGQITTFYHDGVRQPDSPAGSVLVTGPVDPQNLDPHILWRITYLYNLPFAFRIEYDRASADLAQRISDRIRTITTGLNVTELVDVKSILVEPVPEAAFLGRWKAITDGEIREVALQREGRSELTLDRQPDGSGGPTAMSAPWYLTTKQIIIDLKKVYAKGYRYVYRGQINSEGNLVLDRGVIEPQGSFGRSAVIPMVLEKVE